MLGRPLKPMDLNLELEVRPLPPDVSSTLCLTLPSTIILRASVAEHTPPVPDNAKNILRMYLSLHPASVSSWKGNHAACSLLTPWN